MKTQITRFFALLLVCVMLLGLVACGKKSEKKAAKPTLDALMAEMKEQAAEDVVSLSEEEEDGVTTYTYSYYLESGLLEVTADGQKITALASVVDRTVLDEEFGSDVSEEQIAEMAKELALLPLNILYGTEKIAEFEKILREKGEAKTEDGVTTYRYTEDSWDYSFATEDDEELFVAMAKPKAADDEKTKEDKKSGKALSASELKEELSKDEPPATVFFGSCEQDGKEKNGEEAIEWIVAGFHKNENGETQVALITKHCIDVVPYRYKESDYNYEMANSFLAAWTEKFYNETFSEEEIEELKLGMTLPYDAVLNVMEDEDKRATPTKYAESRYDEDYSYPVDANSWWTMPVYSNIEMNGNGTGYVMQWVSEDGIVDMDYARSKPYTYRGFRPVLLVTYN